MPLTAANFFVKGPVKSADMLQFFNLFTGAMTDQPVVFKNTLFVGGNQGNTTVPLRLYGAVGQTTHLLDLYTDPSQAQPGWGIGASGAMAWGPGGVAPQDTFLSRVATQNGHATDTAGLLISPYLEVVGPVNAQSYQFPNGLAMSGPAAKPLQLNIQQDLRVNRLLEVGPNDPVANAGVYVTTPITASGGNAYGASLNQTLTAAANNDTLFGMVISPTFTDGAFTGVTHNALQANGNLVVSGGALAVVNIPFPRTNYGISVSGNVVAQGGANGYGFALGNLQATVIQSSALVAGFIIDGNVTLTATSGTNPSLYGIYIGPNVNWNQPTAKYAQLGLQGGPYANVPNNIGIEVGGLSSTAHNTGIALFMPSGGSLNIGMLVGNAPSITTGTWGIYCRQVLVVERTGGAMAGIVNSAGSVDIALPNNRFIGWNSGNNATFDGLCFDGNDTFTLNNNRMGSISGGSAATLGGITGGPPSTAQQTWWPVNLQGVLRWIPCW